MMEVFNKISKKKSEVGARRLFWGIFYRIYNDLRILPIWRFRKYKSSDMLQEDRKEWYAYQYLKIKFSSYLNALPQYEVSKERTKIIWWCWLQGLDNAPKLCKACLNSIKKTFPDYTIKIITEKNILEYTNVPDYIIDKYKKGIISRAHFADIFRTELLVSSGGVWIDATVFCTDYRVDVFDADLFLFKEWPPRGNKACVCSNWLLSCKKNEPILKTTLELLYEYWRVNNSAVNYFFYHMLLHLAAERYQKEFKRIPSFPNSAPHVLQSELNDTYSVARFEQIKVISDFHKLTWKKSFSKTPNFQSFYDYVISTNKEGFLI